jgi:hypothetical protein
VDGLRRFRDVVAAAYRPVAGYGEWVDRVCGSLTGLVPGRLPAISFVPRPDGREEATERPGAQPSDPEQHPRG